MVRLRFMTVRDLYEALPTARFDIDVEPSDDSPLKVLHELVAGGSLGKAVAMCAYLMPRREAVWWACESVRGALARPTAEEQDNLQAAETWVREPEDENRLAALTGGMRGDQRSPATWVALAAGWSGGDIGQGVYQAMAPPHQTAKAVYSAILMGASRLAPTERVARLRAYVEHGIRLVGDEGPRG